MENNSSPSHHEFMKILEAQWGKKEEKLTTKIQRLISQFDALELASVFAGLSTVGLFQSNNLRIFNSIHAALRFGKSTIKIEWRQVRRLFAVMGQGSVGRAEDPAEDVFIANVSTFGQTYRVFDSTREGSTYQAARFLDVVEGMPDEGSYASTKRSINALLKISDCIVSRSAGSTNTVPGPRPLRVIPYSINYDVDELKARISFSEQDLAALGIDLVDLSPFVFNMADKDTLPYSVQSEVTALESKPFVLINRTLYVLLPRSLTTAIRMFLLDRHTKSETDRDAFSINFVNSHCDNLENYLLLGDLRPPPMSRLPRGNRDSYTIVEFATDVSPGRPVHFVLVVDTFQPGLRAGEDLGVVIGLRDRIIAVRENYLSRSKLKHGITLLIFAGWGRAQFIDLENMVWEKWNIMSMQMHDLCTFSDHPDAGPFVLWRLLRIEELVTSLGGTIANQNGLLNLFGWLLNNDWHLAPHEQLPEEITSAGLRIIIPTESIAQVRMRAAQAQDRRTIQDMNGRTLSLIKHKNKPRFREDFDLPLYVSLDDLSSGQLVSVYLGKFASWWCRCTGIDRQSTFLVWEAVAHWLARIDKVLIEGTAARAHQIDWQLVVFTETVNTEVGSEIQSVREDSNTIITELRFSDDGIFSGPGNQGEVKLIRSLLVTLLPDKEESVIQELLQTIVPGKHAKHLHLIENVTFADMISESLKPPVFPHRAEDSTLRLALGWTTQISGRFTVTEGKEACRKHLAQLVTKVWSELKATLSKYSKLDLCEYLTSNLESLRRDKVQWERTMHALFDLYSDRDNVLAVSNRVRAKINGGNLASRLLIEMAICTCPVRGSEEFDELDISQLMAQALLLRHLGSCSDAIVADLYPPTIHVSAFGQIMLDYSFESTIIEPYQALLNRKQREAEARRATRTGGTNQVPPIEPEFQAAWLQEFGIPLDSLMQVMDVLEDWAAEKGRPSFTVLTSSLVKEVTSKIPSQNQSALHRFISKLTLPSRPAWDEKNPGDGMFAKDWYPWLFRRRLSLVSKPFIALDSNEDPLLLIAPGTIRESIAHLWADSLDCNLDERHFKSDRMKKWIGNHRNEVGTNFNTTVCDKMKTLGWKAEHDVRLTHLLGRNFKRDFGDVDVLSWSEELNIIVAIECKDLVFSKTHKEIGNQINDFLGRINNKGKRDKLLKHFDRLNLLADHLPFLSNKLLRSSNVTLYGMVVFSHTNLLELATQIPHDQILFTSVDKLTGPKEMLVRLISWARKPNAQPSKS